MHKANKDNKWVRSSVSVNALYVYVSRLFSFVLMLMLGLVFQYELFLLLYSTFTVERLSHRIK